jgi:hypothetical protein
MPHTKFIEQCCLSFAERGEYPTDELICYLVRAQELSRRVQDTFSYDDLDNTEVRGERTTSIITKSLLSDLDNLQNSVPVSLRDHSRFFSRLYLLKFSIMSSQVYYKSSTNTWNEAVLTFEFLFLRLWIYEVAFHAEFWEASPAAEGLTALETSSSSVTRLHMLSCSLQSYKELFLKFISQPNSDLLHFTYPIFSKMCYTMISLTKLVRLDIEGESSWKAYTSSSSSSSSASSSASPYGLSNTPEIQRRVPNWDLRVAANDAQLPALARQVQEKFKANATNAVSTHGEPDAMTVFSLLFNTILSGCEHHARELLRQRFMQSESIASSSSSSHSTATSSITTAVAGQDQGRMTTELDYAFLDNTSVNNIGETEHYNGIGGDGQNPTFQMDHFEDSVWERILEDFTIIPPSYNINP